MSFGAKVRQYRKRSDMKQYTLAERVGLTRSHLVEIEGDVVGPPKEKTIVRIIEELHLSQEEADDLIKEAFYTKAGVLRSRIEATLANSR